MPSKRIGLLMNAAQQAADRLAQQLKKDVPFMPFIIALSRDGLHVMTLDALGEGSPSETLIDCFEDSMYEFIIQVNAEAAAILDSGDRLLADPDDELVDRRLDRESVGLHPGSDEVVLIEASDGTHAMQSIAGVLRQSGRVKLGDWDSYRVLNDGYFATFVNAAIEEVKGTG